MTLVPISGPVRPRREWPKAPNDRVHEFAGVETQLSAGLWDQHFGVNPTKDQPPPEVYWSSRLGPNADAVTYRWGICLSRRAYRRVAKSRRSRWLVNVLKHELLHWAGHEHHDKLFRTYLKQIGGTV